MTHVEDAAFMKQLYASLYTKTLTAKTYNLRRWYKKMAVETREELTARGVRIRQSRVKLTNEMPF